MRQPLFAAALAATAIALVAASPVKFDPAIKAAVEAPTRTPANTARDKYRHPIETLTFFGAKPGQTIVEIWPGGGWYTEILAPYLRDEGRYYAATAAASLPMASEATKKAVAAYKDKLAANPALYGKVELTEFRPPLRVEVAPAGTADLVLTFRNVHNWVSGDFELDAFKAFYAALKPGGVLGVVEHRAPSLQNRDTSRNNGYVTEGYIRALAYSAGFDFAGGSPVNNNPNDTKNYPEGVWTLPPVLRLKDVDRDKYVAIGESDRMTLKFMKPKTAK